MRKNSITLLVCFVIWYNHKIDERIVYICSSYLVRNLKIMIEKLKILLICLSLMLRRKKGLTRVKAKIFVVSILDCEHWNVVVLSSEGHLKFDNINNENYHGMNRLHECL